MPTACTNCGKDIQRKIHPNTKRPFCDSLCYGEWQRGKSFASQSKKVRPKKYCSVGGCDSTHFGKGYCRKHYLQLHYQQPNAPVNPKDEHWVDCAYCGKSFATFRKNAKYCSMACGSDDRRGNHIIKKGYKKLLMPEHHRADGKGYVFEHIVVAERKLGRPIVQPEEVHHLDHNPLNNHPDNLVVCADHEEHMKYHLTP